MNINEEVLREQIDPSLTIDNLTAICANSLGKNVEVEKAYILTGGCLNRVIGIDFKSNDPSLVIKATPEKNDVGLKHEFSVLRYFHHNTKIPVPSPFIFDDSSNILPGTYFVMNKIEGVSMHHLNYSVQDIRKITEQIAQIMIELHRNKNIKFGGVEEVPGGGHEEWADFWLPRFDQVVEQVRNGGNVPDSFLHRVDHIRPNFRKLLRIGPESTLTHYDIWSGNIMVDRKNDEVVISGLLDVQGYWADYARELSFMEMFGVANDYFYRLYQEVHQLDTAFHIRKDLYNLKMNLKHVQMYPQQRSYREGAEQCLQTIENELNHL